MKIKVKHLFHKAAFLLLLAAFLPGCRERHRFGYDFEQRAILDTLKWQCGTLFQLAPDHATSGASSLEVTFYPGPPGVDENYPGFSLTDFDRDWSGYRTLVFDAFNPEPGIIHLAVRIDDRENPDYADRYNRGIVLNPGGNSIAIPLPELVTSGLKQPLDLKNILGVMFFLVNPKERHTVYFDRIRVD